MYRRLARAILPFLVLVVIAALTIGCETSGCALQSITIKF
jgi:multisubunit Na+/H+ antiporter MnhB subunit